MYLVLCSKCMHSGTWTLFPVSSPQFIRYGTLQWKIAPKAPSMLHGQRLRPIKPAGVLDFEPKPKENSTEKRRKFSTTDRSPLSRIENKPVKTDSNQERLILFNTNPDSHKPHDPHDHKNLMNPDICKDNRNRTRKKDAAYVCTQ
jgi:hypothetical protein